MQDPSPRFSTLGDALAGMAQRRGESVALRFPESGRSLTFDDWHAGSLRLAGGLSSLGIRPGDHLALLAENRIEWPVVQVAAALTGAVLVPLNTHYRREDLGIVLKQSRARTVMRRRRSAQLHISTFRARRGTVSC